MVSPSCVRLVNLSQFPNGMFSFFYVLGKITTHYRISSDRSLVDLGYPMDFDNIVSISK